MESCLSTDGSLKDFVTNRDAGIFVKFLWRHTAIANGPFGQYCTNYTTEVQSPEQATPMVKESKDCQQLLSPFPLETQIFIGSQVSNKYSCLEISMSNNNSCHWVTTNQMRSSLTMVSIKSSRIQEHKRLLKKHKRRQ